MRYKFCTYLLTKVRLMLSNYERITSRSIVRHSGSVPLSGLCDRLTLLASNRLTDDVERRTAYTSRRWQMGRPLYRCISAVWRRHSLIYGHQLAESCELCTATVRSVRQAAQANDSPQPLYTCII